MVNGVLTIQWLGWNSPQQPSGGPAKVATPGTSSRESQSIAEWLPLLGSIVQALSGMAADDRIAVRPPAVARDGNPSSGETAR